MDIQATKIELIKHLLDENQETVLKKIKAILIPKSKEIIGHIANEPLTASSLNAKLKKSESDIKAGRVITNEDLAKEIETW